MGICNNFFTSFFPWSFPGAAGDIREVPRDTREGTGPDREETQQPPGIDGYMDIKSVNISMERVGPGGTGSPRRKKPVVYRKFPE